MNKFARLVMDMQNGIAIRFQDNPEMLGAIPKAVETTRQANVLTVDNWIDDLSLNMPETV
ncbi:hypothetical protein [Alicyclobacillus fodiniaquatilis]|jgi:hypothetical protein|uniref:Isochorismatase family protein n=1 Tax=Alicyclobacillus fodiniaquatilis TaxID=1661150 RepID=A0ABW4JBZ6_9BACL